LPQAGLHRNDDGSQSKQVVHGVPEILLAPEIVFGRLNRGVAEQKLDLLDLPTIGVAQLRAGPPQVVRSDVL